MADQLITGTTLVEKESRSIGDIPIGGIVAWAKSFPGVPTLPEGFLECDGSVVVDSLSPLNGQTLPDLNGREFLKGAATSGTTGGGETHNHQWNEAAGTSYDTAGTANVDLTNNFVSTTSSDVVIWAPGVGPATAFTKKEATPEPKNYTVVWVMRIR